MGEPKNMAEVVAHLLRPSERKALTERRGRGNFSGVTLDRLSGAGLMDPHDYYPTALGEEVRKALMGARYDGADNAR